MDVVRRLSVQTKILVIPVFGAIGFLVYLLTSMSAMSDNVVLLKNAKDVQFPLLQISERSLIALDNIKIKLSDAVSMGEEEQLQQASQLYTTLKEQLNKAASIDSEIGAEVNDISSQLDSYFQHAYSLSKGMLDETIDFSTVGESSTKMSKLLADLQENLKSFNQRRSQDFLQAFVTVEEDTESTNSIGIIIGMTTIVLLFAVAIPISLSIKSSLTDIIGSMKNIAEEDGDLTVRITTQNQDEIGDLVFWFNSFIVKLHNAIDQTVGTAKPLAKAADTIRELTHRSQIIFEEQQASAEQSKLSVEEMNQSVERISQNAQQASESAGEATTEANKGFEVVQETVSSISQLADNITDSSTAVNKLEQGSNKVNVVLEVIKGIAEQTNLLALNAAIEAARAGEQGRGFAVVADEVRNLASRTQESTEEINVILDELKSAADDAVSKMELSQNMAENSVTNANLAGDSIQGITTKIVKIDKMNQEIADDTKYQSEVSHSLVKKVSAIQEKTSESNKASAQLDEASSQLSELAGVLETITSQFKV
ncbi:MAG: methyl-accepting chemotaxis protein [Kangiellaceae bacterium]|jgi:methyl-accepting chemotaxis protein